MISRETAIFQFDVQRGTLLHIRQLNRARKRFPEADFILNPLIQLFG